MLVESLTRNAPVEPETVKVLIQPDTEPPAAGRTDTSGEGTLMLLP